MRDPAPPTTRGDCLALRFGLLARCTLPAGDLPWQPARALSSAACTVEGSQPGTLGQPWPADLWCAATLCSSNVLLCRHAAVHNVLLHSHKHVTLAGWMTAPLTITCMQDARLKALLHNIGPAGGHGHLLGEQQRGGAAQAQPQGIPHLLRDSLALCLWLAPCSGAAATAQKHANSCGPLPDSPCLTPSPWNVLQGLARTGSEQLQNGGAAHIHPETDPGEVAAKPDLVLCSCSLGEPHPACSWEQPGSSAIQCHVCQ